MVNVNDPPLRLRLRALVGVACLSRMPPESPPRLQELLPHLPWVDCVLQGSNVLSPTLPKRRTCTSVRFFVGIGVSNRGRAVAELVASSAALPPEVCPAAAALNAQLACVVDAGAGVWTFAVVSIRNALVELLMTGCNPRESL